MLGAVGQVEAQGKHQQVTATFIAEKQGRNWTIKGLQPKP